MGYKPTYSVVTNFHWHLSNQPGCPSFIAHFTFKLGFLILSGVNFKHPKPTYRCISQTLGQKKKNLPETTDNWWLEEYFPFGKASFFCFTHNGTWFYQHHFQVNHSNQILRGVDSNPIRSLYTFIYTIKFKPNAGKYTQLSHGSFGNKSHQPLIPTNVPQKLTLEIRKDMKS